MAKTESKTENKTTKKGRRRLKRSVRKTLGALFLVSAIVVAAIPVDGLQAWEGSTTSTNPPQRVWVADTADGTENANSGTIPVIAKDTEVYYSANGAFTFALNFGTTSTSNYPSGLIVLGYDSSYNLEAITGGTLTIDDTYDVYAPYGNGSRCAWGTKGYVFYMEKEQFKRSVDGPNGTRLDQYGFVVKTKDGAFASKPADATSDEWGIEDTYEGVKQWIYFTTDMNKKTLTYEHHVADVSGNMTAIEEIEYDLQPYVQEVYKPCLSGEIEKWETRDKNGWKVDANGTISSEGLYYKGGEGDTNLNAAGYGRVDGDIKRYKDIPLTYIGNQEIELDTATNRYKVSDKFITSAEKGIFSRDKVGNAGSTSSVTAVKFGSSLLGIGDYAFYGSSINSVEFSGGMNVIGDYAFANCGNLQKVTLTDHGLRIIGAHAFENCVYLPEFTAPSTMEAIGDAAFKGCTSLTKIDLGTDEGAQLRRLGYYVFENCESLESLTFPLSLAETVPISTIKGCVNLKYVKHLSNSTTQTFTFVDDDDASTYYNYKLENFRQELLDNSNEDFYFEGYQGNNAAITPLHQTARDNLFAFKYLNENRYEITTQSYNADGSGPYNATYQAMYNGGTMPDTLLTVIIDPKMENVTIPGAIGPCRVTVIGSTSFQNNCNLVSVTIPGTITEIASNAFMGCHNLKTVTFDYEDDELEKLTIGANAFATQNVSTNNHEEHDVISWEPDKKPQLFFEGPISVNFAAFQYAMNPNNRIDYGDQDGPTYITYFSGWPSNLVVRYNGSTKKQELIAYPTLSNVLADDTGLLDNKNQPIKWTDLNYIKFGDEYKNAFGNGITGAFSSYLNNGSISGNQRDLIDAILNIELPEGIQSVAWFKNPGSSVSGSDSSSDHIASTAIGVDDAEEISLFTLNAAKEKNVTGIGQLTPGRNTLYGSKTITTNGLEILDRTFEDCDTLQAVYIQGNTTAMGDYAFMGCSELTGVEIPIAMRSMGKRPFTGCENLTTVSCPSSPYFTCKDSILFGPAENGTITKVIECLEGRRPNGISGEDLAGSTEMAEEAFAGTNVTSVDMRETTIKNIPASAFQYTKRLLTVQLPYDLTRIGRNAFSDSAIESLDFIGNNLNFVESNAFDDTMAGEYAGMTDKSNLTFACQPGSNAEAIAKEMGINVKNIAEVNYCTVEFYAEDQTTLLYSLGNVRTGTSVDVDKLIQDGLIKVEQRPGYLLTWFPNNYDPVPSGSTGTIKTYAQYVVDEGVKYTVTFVDDDFKVIDTQVVSPTQSVRPPYMEPKNGVPFSSWICVGGDYNIKDLQTSAASLTSDVTFMAVYSESEGFLVSFLDWDGTVLYAKVVQAGESVTYPGTPRRDGYIFKNWSGDTTNITKETTVFAIYELDPSNSSSGNGSGGNGSGGNGSNGNGTVSGNGKYYTLTVRNGSGSGSYVAGSQAIIVANDPAAGMEFSNWTIEPTNTTIASTGISATVITMPETNVTVVANYRTKSGTSSGSGTTGSSNSSNRPGTSGTLNNGGTTVVINKNGLSNTGVVSATVNGSSDNFTIKISESQSASESVVRALMAEYNNDLSSIKYFPMDISLYDSTGQKKITDTTGLKITITLPLPDSLKEYAGNNKVAGVVNDRLDKLTPRFTTISGVPCITFTAEHFSPYVIYVDTTNLSANGMADSTPKTGDGIHPKWFLSMGLGCLSIVFFMKKDKKKEKRPVKVKA